MIEDFVVSRAESPVIKRMFFEFSVHRQMGFEVGLVPHLRGEGDGKRSSGADNGNSRLIGLGLEQ